MAVASQVSVSANTTFPAVLSLDSIKLNNGDLSEFCYFRLAAFLYFIATAW